MEYTECIYCLKIVECVIEKGQINLIDHTCDGLSNAVKEPKRDKKAFNPHKRNRT